MKNFTYIILIIIVALFSSCAKESIENGGGNDVPIINEDSGYLSSFAQILSAAVYNEPELRDYIKVEALAEFDMDHDVFYPFVKDEVVSTGKTFRDVLKKYDTEGVLEAIEAHEPLLNILVPDWSWVDSGCFSVNSWDTSIKEVLVTYSSAGKNNPMYGNGRYVGSFAGNEFTSQPVLIVKRNERLVHNMVKSGDVHYDFADPAYDGSVKIKTKGHWTEHVYDLGVTLQSEGIHQMSAPSKIRMAYNQSRINSNMPQRDYIYYNMSAEVDTGRVDCSFSERLYRFRFSSSLINGLYDDETTSGKDGELCVYEWNPGYAIPDDQIKDYTWLEGDLDMVFTVKSGSHIYKKVLPSISFKSAFSVRKVHFLWYSNLFGAVTFRKYWVEKEDLIPRWITLNEELFTWDLLNYPVAYSVSVEERDSDITISYSETRTSEYATNFSSTGSVSSEMLKIGWGTGASSNNSVSQTFSMTTQQGNDELGTCEVQYVNPIIVGISGNVAMLQTYSTGAVNFQILPKQMY